MLHNDLMLWELFFVEGVSEALCEKNANLLALGGHVRSNACQQVHTKASTSHHSSFFIFRKCCVYELVFVCQE